MRKTRQSKSIFSGKCHPFAASEIERICICMAAKCHFKLHVVYICVCHLRLRWAAAIEILFTIFWFPAYQRCNLGWSFKRYPWTHMHNPNYLNHWPTLNIASPDLLSTLQNWHDGVIWDSTPPLIASDEGMVDRRRHTRRAEKWGLAGWGMSRVVLDGWRGVTLGLLSVWGGSGSGGGGGGVGESRKV